MECSRFIEEKIEETESPEFRDHRAGCPGCARDLEELGEVRALYREASTERYEGGVPRVRRFGRGAWVPAVAAAAVMIGVLLFLLVPSPSPPPGTESEHTAFFRVHLEPWNAGEARIDRALDGLWNRLEELERIKK